jgi:hypothetical protein
MNLDNLPHETGILLNIKKNTHSFKNIDLAVDRPVFYLSHPISLENVRQRTGFES